MALKVAIQMDPVERINIETDTTFMMMMEAQDRGHALWIYTPDRSRWRKAGCSPAASRSTCGR